MDLSNRNNSNSFDSKSEASDLLQTNDRWLRIAVYSRLRSADATDEVMQEVAIAVIQGLPKLRDLSKVKPWLYQIAIRQSLLYRRKIGRTKKLAARDVSAESLDPAYKSNEPAGIDWLISAERQKLVKDALQQLPRRDAEILMLKYIEGWKYQQIANHLGISTSSVEARLHRARNRLRAKLRTSDLAPV